MLIAGLDSCNDREGNGKTGGKVMNKPTGGTIGLLDVGTGMLLLGAGGQNSVVSQVVSANGGLIPIYRDLMVFGLALIGCAALNHFWHPVTSEKTVPFEMEKPNTQIAVNICAGLLIAFFFLPWAHAFGFAGSGYQLAKIGLEGSWALLVPVLAIIVLLNAALNRPTAWAAIIAGFSPFLILLYGLAKIGKVVFQFLDIGALLTLGTGLVLIICAQNFLGLKTVKSAEVG
jgi:hypothetical protein